jgi:hypothetical protein
LVNTGKPITTIVEGLCCSIATVIFMAGTERKLTENSRFLIHNPWGNGEGDAAYFRQYANELHNPYQAAQQQVTPQTKQNMDKTKKNRFGQLISGLKNLVKDFNNEAPNMQAANKTLTGDAGDLYFDGDLAEGTAIYTDDALTIPAADGDYEFEDGTAITVASGLVTDVTQPSDGTTTNDDPQGKAVLASLRKKLASLKAEKQELETALAESETVMASASKALQLAKSSYRPDKRENKFNHATKPTGTELVDKMEARRQELKAKKSGKSA